MSDQTKFRQMEPSDWPAVSQVYAEGISTGNATFETQVPDWPDWDSGHLQACRLVAEIGGEVAAWAALSATSRREVYRGVAEVSIYVGTKAQNRGVGSALLERLVECSEKEGFWTLQAGVFPENKSSVLLHQRLGFRVVGTRERIATRDGRWRDVVLLERRSAIVGT